MTAAAAAAATISVHLSNINRSPSVRIVDVYVCVEASSRFFFTSLSEKLSVIIHSEIAPINQMLLGEAHHRSLHWVNMDYHQ